MFLQHLFRSTPLGANTAAQTPPVPAHLPIPELIPSGTVSAERNAKWNRGVASKNPERGEKSSSLRPGTLPLYSESKLTQQGMTPDREHDTTPFASRVSNMQDQIHVSTGLIVAPDCWRREPLSPSYSTIPENLPLHTHVARALASLVHQLCISRLLHARCLHPVVPAKSGRRQTETARIGSIHGHDGRFTKVACPAASRDVSGLCWPS